MFNITGDYHTHTKYSDGKGVIEENVQKAAKIGLKAVAITDHGLNRIARGLKRKHFEKIKRQIADLSDKYKIKVLFGVEANIISSKGFLDLKEDDFKFFDLVLAGYHVGVYPKGVKDAFWMTKNFLYRNSREANTKAYINVIKKNKIDIITHLNSKIRVNCKEVAKAAYEHNILIELNGKRIDFTRDEFMEMYQTGVNFIINSDAHSPSRVGDISVAENFLKGLDIFKERIVNLHSIPVFLKGK